MSDKADNTIVGAARQSSAPAGIVLTDSDLSTFELEHLLELTLSGVFPAPPDAAETPGQEELAANDFTQFSLDQLLTLSVSGADEAEPASDDRLPDSEEEGEGEEDEEKPDSDKGSPGDLPEVTLSGVEWLAGAEDPSLMGAGRFDGDDRAVPGLLPSLRGGPGSVGLGDLPVPPSLPSGGSGGGGSGGSWTGPAFLLLADGTVTENWQAGDLVGIISGSSGFSGAIGFTLDDSAGGRFILDSASGELRIANGAVFDFTVTAGHNILITADDGSLQVQQSFIIEVSPGDLDGAGAAGNQILVGANGNVDDGLYGGAGDDIASGLNGDDQLYGGSGNDQLIGGNHDDSLYGGSGDDQLSGGNHDDSLYGGTGNDSLDGGDHDDLLVGGGGDDLLLGGAGGDALDGGGGDDSLDGGAGSDTLAGGAGDDSLVWDTADKLIDGGGGEDTLLVVSGGVSVADFNGSLQSIEVIDLASDAQANSLHITAAEVLALSDSGLLTVLGDDQDSIVTGSGWSLAESFDDGRQLFVQSHGGELAGLLLDPGVTMTPDGLS